MSLKYQVEYEINLGLLEYCRYGEPHRVGGPAVMWQDSDLFWYEYEKLHRLDGPAVIYNNNALSYYIRGKKYSSSEYHKTIKIDPVQTNVNNKTQ